MVGFVALDRTSATRRKLLDAARDEFARHGIAGARVDQIAALSTVNKQRIYANFGSKLGLFTASIVDAYADLAEEVPVPETEEDVYRYVEEIFDFHVRNNQLARMIAWEGLYYDAGDIPDREERKAYYVSKCTKLAAALHLASPDTAAHLVLTLIAIATWPFVAEQQRILLTASGEEGLQALRASLSAYGKSIVDAEIAQARQAPPKLGT